MASGDGVRSVAANGGAPPMLEALGGGVESKREKRERSLKL